MKHFCLIVFQRQTSGLRRELETKTKSLEKMTELESSNQKLMDKLTALQNEAVTAKKTIHKFDSELKKAQQ